MAEITFTFSEALEKLKQWIIMQRKNWGHKYIKNECESGENVTYILNDNYNKVIWQPTMEDLKVKDWIIFIVIVD